jgi:uncharacterized Zn-binding protein involved in type VI secretion
MPSAARQTDQAQGNCAHGCPICPHPVGGILVSGSPDVLINGLPAARKDDKGLHAACCAANNFTVSSGSATVTVNGKPMARAGDPTQHCGGSGSITAGSPTVMVGG